MSGNSQWRIVVGIAIAGALVLSYALSGGGVENVHSVGIDAEAQSDGFLTTGHLALPDDPKGRQEARAKLYDSGPANETTPQSAPDGLVPNLMSSIIGTLRVPPDFVQSDLVVTVDGRTKSIRDSSRFREIQVAHLSGIPNANTVDYGWSVEPLPPGDYTVTYAGNSVQGVTLKPGINEVFASFGGTHRLQILCVDADSGSPISASSAFWANLYGNMPSGAFSQHLGPQHGLVEVGETVTLEGIMSDQIAVYIRALGYASTAEKLSLADGPVQVVEMRPVFHLVIRLLDAKGDPVKRFSDPFLGKKVRLVIGEDVHSAMASGMNKKGLYADYDGLEEDQEEWTLVPPARFQIQELDDGSIGPGRTLQVTLRPSL